MKKFTNDENNLKWWNKKWGSEKYCSITQSRLRSGKYKDGINRCVYLDCSHGFYTRPLLQWLWSNSTCPSCREYVDIEKLFKLLNNI